MKNKLLTVRQVAEFQENKSYSLSKKAIEDFKQIYKNKYGNNLSDAETYRLAIKLLNLYKAVYGSPMLNEGLRARKVDIEENNP